MSLRDELQEIQSKQISQQEIKKIKEEYQYKLLLLLVKNSYTYEIKKEILLQARQKRGVLCGETKLPCIYCRKAESGDGKRNVKFYFGNLPYLYEESYKNLEKEWYEKTKDISNLDSLPFDEEKSIKDEYNLFYPSTWDIIKKRYPKGLQLEYGGKIEFFIKEFIKIAKEDEVLIDEIFFIDDDRYYISMLNPDSKWRADGMFSAVIVKWHINL